ncbi:hypothetical protein AX16_009276 [Volvariella volvacea WC 439]|nr:hypothetical protein AX16_009276 [Volvariella volvacea WC 439]
MPVDQKLNVFSGEDAIKDFYDPDKNIPVPLVELPARLNPFRQDGVRIYAKLMSHLPATNVKSLPALNLILRGKERGAITEDTHTLVEYSSGSTVISLGILSNIFGIPKVKAYVSNKTSRIKLDLLRFFGLEVTLFGGPVQPEHLDQNGGIFIAGKDGEKPGAYNPDQYSNPENYEAHMRWSGPQIEAQLPGISVFAASIGTAGTMTGTGLYLKRAVPSITTVGVLTAPNDRVPGPRTLNLLIPVEFPWREAIDHYEEVASPESYEKSLELCRNGILVGPSSGLTLVGLLNFLKKQKEAGKLDSLRNADGEIPCAFICCDQPFQYIGEYYTKLGPSHFRDIVNEELFDTDLWPYNIDWEITPEKAYQLLHPTTPSGILGRKNVVILDLRNEDDFQFSHFPNSLNLDVNARNRPNPYKDNPTLAYLWKLFEERLSDQDPVFGQPLQGKKVILISYKGHVARLAMSVLRHRGIEAYTVIGGSEAWEKTPFWVADRRAQSHL